MVVVLESSCQRLIEEGDSLNQTGLEFTSPRVDVQGAKFNGRLTSLDVFRGLAILGMLLVNVVVLSDLFPQLRHADWHGWTFADLVFPFFLFIVGVAIPFSLGRRIELGYSRRRLFGRVVRRTLILFALGLLLNVFLTYDLSTIRIMGVLQRIALCYFFASATYLTSRISRLAIWGVALLFVYWGLMELVPVPGIGAGVYEKGRNFAAYVDQLILDGHIHQFTKIWDPEGIVSTIPAISTTLFGVLTGHWLRSNRNAIEKTLWLFIMGNLGIFFGTIWDAWLPINKNLWTSSFAVLTAGFALVFLGFCYYFIDFKGYRRWVQPFVILGMNSLTVYVIAWIVTIFMADYIIRFFSWFGPVYGSLSYVIVLILLIYLIAWILYKKRMFIRI